MSKSLVATIGSSFYIPLSNDVFGPRWKVKEPLDPALKVTRRVSSVMDESVGAATTVTVFIIRLGETDKSEIDLSFVKKDKTVDYKITVIR